MSQINTKTPAYTSTKTFKNNKSNRVLVSLFYAPTVVFVQMNVRLLQLIWIFPFLLFPWWLNIALAAAFPHSTDDQLIGASVFLGVAIILAVALTLATLQLHTAFHTAHLQYDPDIEFYDPNSGMKVRLAYRKNLTRHRHESHKEELAHLVARRA